MTVYVALVNRGREPKRKTRIPVIRLAARTTMPTRNRRTDSSIGVPFRGVRRFLGRRRVARAEPLAMRVVIAFFVAIALAVAFHFLIAPAATGTAAAVPGAERAEPSMVLGPVLSPAVGGDGEQAPVVSPDRVPEPAPTRVAATVAPPDEPAAAGYPEAAPEPEPEKPSGAALVDEIKRKQEEMMRNLLKKKEDRQG